MSITVTIPTPRLRCQPHAWNETDAAALTVAGVTAIHVKPATVRAVVAESLDRHGGPEGVRTELDRRLADTPHAARRTARILEWARRLLSDLNLEATR